MYKVLVVEDEQHCYKSLERLLNTQKDFKIIHHTRTVEGAIKAYHELSPDLIFLDVELEDGNGFDFINTFENIKTPIIFTTAHSKHAVRAIEERAFHYLVKPILKRKFLNALEQFINLQNTSSHVQIHPNKNESYYQKEKIFLPTIDGKLGYNINTIESIRAKGSSSLVYFNTDEPIIITKPIKWFENKLNFKPFMKVHRSYLVNIDKILKISRGENIEVICEGGSSVEVSKQYKQDFLNALEI